MPTPSQHPVLDAKACYAAFKAHDARFDGRIYVCVASTGIYCRPVCRVRMPREVNCSFRTSAAAAEAAGYRPCRKCRPELAPGFSPVDQAGSLARRAAGLLDEDALDGAGIPELASALGVTDRHLRRAFIREYGVPPVSYLQTKRLLLAKSLLTDSSLPVTAIAFAAGFGSVRRFNALFRERYRMPPAALRKRHEENETNPDDGITLRLGYRPPYDWERILAFLEQRCVPKVESVADGEYRRTVALRDGDSTLAGWMRVRNVPAKHVLSVTVSPSLLPVLVKTLARVRRLFDLDCEPEAVYETLAAMNSIKPGLCALGTRLPGCFEPFEMAVRAVLGQQVTVKAARTLTARLVEAFGTPVATPFPELSRIFPTPGAVRELGDPIESRLGPLGIVGARARSIRALADALLRGEVRFEASADPDGEMERLLALPGFGPWTVHYIAMRALGHPDAFPHADYGVKKALGDRPPRDILALAEAWRPWRAYATINLWNSL